MRPGHRGKIHLCFYCEAQAPPGPCVLAVLGRSWSQLLPQPQISQPCPAPSPVQVGVLGGGPERLSTKPRQGSVLGPPAPGKWGRPGGMGWESLPVLWGLAQPQGPSLLGGAWPGRCHKVCRGRPQVRAGCSLPRRLPCRPVSSVWPGVMAIESPLPSSMRCGCHLGPA